jgi:hypothetical protein
MVAVEAFPVRLAVMVPAEKLLLPSLTTMAKAVFAEAAVVFALGRTPVTAVACAKDKAPHVGSVAPP